MGKTENYLRLCSIVFYAHIRLIALTTMLFSAAAVAIAFLYPPSYLLEGAVIVKSKALPSAPEGIQQQYGYRENIPPAQEDVLLEIKLISSETLIRQSLEKLAANSAIELPEQGDPTPLAELTAEISDNLNTEIVPGSYIVDVFLRHSDPAIGAKILNSILDTYLDYRRSVFSNSELDDFFEDQLDRYIDGLDELEKQRIEVMKECGISDPQSAATLQSELIHAEQKAIAELQDECVAKQTELQYFNETLAEYLLKTDPAFRPFPFELEDADIARLNTTHSELLMEHSEASRVFKDDTPKMKSLDAEILKLWKKLVGRIKSEIDTQEATLKARAETLSAKKTRLTQLIERNAEIAQAAAQINKLDRELTLRADLYEIFSRKLEESRIEQTSQITQTSNVQVIGYASVPDKPYFPKKALVIPIGIVAGLFLGLALAFVKELLDHTFKTPEDVAQQLGLPVIGSLPVRNQRHRARGFAQR